MIILKSTKYQKEKIVDYCKEIKGAPVFKFNDTHNINDAYKLVGYQVYGIKPNQTEIPNSNILNFLVKDINGQVWGRVKDIETSDFNQLLEVETHEDKIIYVPFVDAIVKEINEEKKLITIDPPEGLKDLNK